MQASLRLKDTLAWRRHEQVDTILCRACSAQPNSHYLQVVGHDTLQRPVLYSIFSMAKNKSVEDNRQHMISTFEQVRWYRLADCDQEHMLLACSHVKQRCPLLRGLHLVLQSTVLFECCH